MLLTIVVSFLLGGVNAAHALVSQENPPTDRVADLGGVVTFSGWKCPGNGGHHGTITMSVDGGAAEVIGARLGRGDTAGPCKNDGRNGYAALRNLGLDGTGQHVVRFFDDGVSFAEATYNVVRLGETFVREADRTAVVRDFPRRGQTTTLRWVQGQQTFVPVGFCEGDCPCAVLERPSCAETQAGSISVAATVCNFCAGPIAPATLSVRCGGAAFDEPAGASLIGSGECRELPCPDCGILAPGAICSAGQAATITVSLTGGDDLVGHTQCCLDDLTPCSLDRQCCSGSCVLEGNGPGTCRPTTCGNGIVQPGESCDGADVDGLECEDLVGGVDGCAGKVACNAACGFDLSACRCDCEGDLDCQSTIDCNAHVPGCVVFGACENGTCVTAPLGTPGVCLGQDPEFGEARCPTP